VVFIIRILLGKLGITDLVSFKAFIVQFLKFGTIGVFNTLFGWSIYYLFLWINPEIYQVGNAFGWTLGVLNSVFWNRKFVFNDTTERFLKILGRAYLAYGASFLLTIALLHIQVEWIGIPAAIAPLICLVFTVPLNFLISKFWAFKSFKKKEIDS